MKSRIAIEWCDGTPSGTLQVLFGRLKAIRIARGKGRITGNRFTFSSSGGARLRCDLQPSPNELGAESTVVTVACNARPFTFFLRDVSAERPILIPSHGVVVTEASDRRTYAQIARDVEKGRTGSVLGRMQAEPEESYASAAGHTRELTCPTWLGLGRDMRIFQVGFEFDSRGCHIRPQFHGHATPIEENNNEPVEYSVFLGRGVGCVRDITRRLEDGVLPILHARVVDDDVQYHCTTFVTLESSRLTAKTLRGSHFLVADGYGHGHMFTPEQAKLRQSLLAGELNRREETVLYLLVEAVNTGATPRYAWFKTLWPSSSKNLQAQGFDGATGLASYASGRVYAISMVNGAPLPQEEMAVLLEPGQKCRFEVRLPHRPISRPRALRLARQDFAARRNECRAFWQARLSTAAQVHLPEPRLDEMVRAGLLHLDLVAYGLEPSGTVAPTIGVYCPIGSESSPIIQFMDSMGWHDLARRSLTYFLDKQHEDGFIQNFGGYMLETGAALWSMGEHYRYTRDEAWVRAVRPKLLKACEFLRAWRRRNMKPKSRQCGYGMLEGKVADPVDPYHSFMLNGYAYLGLRRAAEMLGRTDPAQSRRLEREARGLRQDIRTAFFQSIAHGPAVPLGDGTWCPTCAPWAEAQGPLCLFCHKGTCFTHGTFMARDALLGPIYLVMQEVLAPQEPAADWLIQYHSEMMNQRNVGFSQPYYSAQPRAHLMRGEVKPFLKAYYNGFAGLADRQTYTFWEHFFHASPHKTHEEAWFLMQTRWMLYMEEGDTLQLLPGVPRTWLEHGQTIELKNVATYFGPLSLRVVSRLAHGVIEATVECEKARHPRVVELRLPHPLGQRAVSAIGGRYESARELVRIVPFRGKARVQLRFE